jgi:hypothetical protein
MKKSTSHTWIIEDTNVKVVISLEDGRNDVTLNANTYLFRKDIKELIEVLEGILILI